MDERSGCSSRSPRSSTRNCTPSGNPVTACRTAATRGVSAARQVAFGPHACRAGRARAQPDGGAVDGVRVGAELVGQHLEEVRAPIGSRCA